MRNRTPKLLALALAAVMTYGDDGERGNNKC